MSGPIKPCARCGIKRQARKESATCRDCNSVLTRHERTLWNRKEET